MTRLALALLFLALAAASWHGWQESRGLERAQVVTLELLDEYASGQSEQRIDRLRAELGRLFPDPSPALSELTQYGSETLTLSGLGRLHDARVLFESKVRPAGRRLADEAGTRARAARPGAAMAALLTGIGMLLLAMLGRDAWRGSALPAAAAPPVRPETDYTERVLRSLQNLLIVLSPDGSVRAVNAVACESLGYSEAELVGASFDKILAQSQDPVTMASCRNIEATYRARDGSHLAVLMSSSLVSDKSGELQAIVTLAQDITLRKQAESELQVKESRLRQLMDRVIRAQEDERRSMARDLHDGMLQYIIAAELQLQAFQKKAGGTENLTRGLEYLRSSVEEGRRLINNLRPSPLEQFGLVETLRRQLDDGREEMGWEVDFRPPLGDLSIPPPLETSLFRIAGESLNNVRRHARTRRVAVSLDRTGGEIQLEVRDWGVGFDPGASSVGVGLESMRERAELLRGWFSVSSQPGEGTVVRAGFPVS